MNDPMFSDREGPAVGAFITRSTDKKGRVTLPRAFADHLVIIEQVSATEIRIKKARAIPENEVWLWNNPVAAERVLKGIESVKAGRTGVGPDLDADAAMIADWEEASGEPSRARPKPKPARRRG
jgi:hypothetical protein